MHTGTVTLFLLHTKVRFFLKLKVLNFHENEVGKALDFEGELVS